MFTWKLLLAVSSALITSGIAGEAMAASTLTPLPIQSVQIDDPFWSPKFETWRRVTIADCLDKFERDGTLTNFDAVARGDLTAKHGGEPWFDGLLYEMIRACTTSWPRSPTRR
ncbi:MAG: hypothetical protein QM770_07180 [Tepidisphaeraceae bacterium]